MVNLDRTQVRAVGGQREQTGPGPVDRPTRPGDLVRLQVVPGHDLNSGVNVPYKSAVEWTAEVGKERDGSADANVFLVGKWRGISDDHYKDVLGSFIIATRDIVLDDHSSQDSFMTTLAHEFGHFLGYRKGHKFGHPDADKKHWLMTTIDKNAGIKIPRQYVLDFNPW